MDFIIPQTMKEKNMISPVDIGKKKYFTESTSIHDKNFLNNKGKFRRD